MRRGLAIGIVVAATALGCGGGGREDPMLQLSAEEALDEGKVLMEAKKYMRAQEYFGHAYEVEPNSATGREALLLGADALFEAGGRDNYIRAEARYRDFQNRFPTTRQGPYVVYRVAESLANRVLQPDRDQSSTRKAIEAYEEVLLLYPDSEYAERAREQITALRARLAESEYRVGRFYFRAGLAKAAVGRFSGMLSAYPDYPELDKVLYYLGMAYRKYDKAEQARSTFERLRAEYPDSSWVHKIPRLPDPEPAPAAPAGDEEAEAE